MQTETTYFYSLGKQTKILLVCAAMTALFWWLVPSVELINPVKQWLGKVFMYLSPFVTAWVGFKMLNRKPVLTISAQGVKDRRLSPDFIAWDVIDNVDVIQQKVSGKTVSHIYLNVSRANRRSLGLNVWARLNASMAGLVKAKGLHINTAMLALDPAEFRDVCSRHLMAIVAGQGYVQIPQNQTRTSATKLFG